MYTVGLVIALVGFAVFGIGLFLFMFRRGKRLRGIGLTVGSMLLVSLAGGLMQRSEQAQVALPQAVISASSTGIGASSIAVEASQPLTPTPEELALSAPTALQAYCLSLPEFAEVLAEADQKFGTEYSGKRELWLNAHDEEIVARVTDAIGVPYVTWFSYANADGWMHRCDADARNWSQVELGDLGLATSDDGRRVADAIEREYAARFLYKSTDGPLFELSRYSMATCKSDVVEGFRFVGCKMIGDRFTSGPLFYLVANQGGEPIIVPFDSATTAHMLKPRYPDKDSVALRVGKYVGPYPLPGVNFAKVESFFD